jgi:hypothetical protein
LEMTECRGRWEGRRREEGAKLATRKDMTCEEPSWGRHHLRPS